jgi:hypothetical protein
MEIFPMSTVTRRVAGVVLTTLGVVAACGEPAGPGGSAGPTLPPGVAFDISDAAHGGLPGFYFLPPMVPDPGPFTGTFDATLSPVVRICPWNGTACTGADVVFNGGSGSEQITVNTMNESYGATWITSRANLSAGSLLRLRVYADAITSTALGFADLVVVNKTKDLKDVQADHIGLVRNIPFQIRFRIETDGAGDAAPAVASSVPADGATDVAATSDVVLTFNEAVDVTGAWVQIACGTSGARLDVNG